MFPFVGQEHSVHKSNFFLLVIFSRVAQWYVDRVISYNKKSKFCIVRELTFFRL